MYKTVLQFGFRSGKPPIDMPVVDCRRIPNGLTRNVSYSEAMNRVRRNRNFEPLVKQALKLLEEHDVIAIGCEWGIHRSGSVVDEVAKRRDDVRISHRGNLLNYYQEV